VITLAGALNNALASNGLGTNLWKPEVTAVVRSRVVERAISAITGKFFLPRPGPIEHSEGYIQVDRETRAEFIARARLWELHNINALTPGNIRSGQKTNLTNDQAITCDYVPEKKQELGGSTPKFRCIGSGGQTYHVKYGKPKAYTAVVASRLLWALGYGADISTPVRVICNGCPHDPWNHPVKISGRTRFDEAVIDELQKGKEITLSGKTEVGWSWKKDLPLVSEQKGGAPKAQVDGLKLLSALIQHVDSKPAQQKLICRPKDYDAKGDTCRQPYMYVHDFGNTFGSGGLKVHPLNFREWAGKRVWKDSRKCVADVQQNVGNGDDGLNYPKISEEGRVFLAHLLSQLIANRDNVVAIFDAAHIGNVDHTHTAKDWAAVFIEKAQEVIDHSPCPN
jgi:hypothetical protein